MKKLVILFTLILFIISCGGKVREEILERYDNGQKSILVKYQGEGSDEVITERIIYNKNGDTLVLEKPVEKYKIEREYSYQGKIKEEKIFNDEVEVGKKVFSYNENGTIKKVQIYKDGKKWDGKWTSYHKNGQINYEMTYKDGEKDGLDISWYENGQKELEGNYKDGKKDGLWTVWYVNGKKEFSRMENSTDSI